jgi:hypothetical protein
VSRSTESERRAVDSMTRRIADQREKFGQSRDAEGARREAVRIAERSDAERREGGRREGGRK